MANTITLEQQIGKGEFNEVYRSGELAVKLFNKGYSKADVMNEAYIQARIEEVGGINIPKLHSIPLMNDRYGIVMDYIPGKNMAELIYENPKDTEKYIDKLVDIQMEIHTKRCPYLIKMRDKLADRINRSDLDEDKKFELLTMLDGSPKHNKVTHGDFTPHNIMVGEDGKIYILDWNHASQGNASADVARTYLWLCLHHKEIAELYLDMFCQKSRTDKRYVQRWMPVVAGARLIKKKDGEEELLRKWVDVVLYE